MKYSDTFIIASATLAPGIPEDLQNSVIQIITAIIAWGLTKLFDRFGNKKKPN